jgi:hypothetical protein
LALLKRPYWQRVWIIQELALNRHFTIFLCGNRAFFSRELAAAIICQKNIEHIKTAVSQSHPDDPWPVIYHVFELLYP